MFDHQNTLTHIDFGMPCAAYNRALSETVARKDRTVTTDVAFEGAFPGARAWSPPI